MKPCQPPATPSPRVVGSGLLLCLLFTTVCLQAAELKEARVTQVVNDVKLLPQQAAPLPATVNASVRNGTAVRTGVDSRSELTFTDQTLARLGANTVFSFAQGTRNLDLGGGAMLLQVPKNAGGAKITTAAVTAAVTGTTLIMENHPATKTQPRPYFKIIVLEGTVRAYQPNKIGESVLIHSGQMVIGRPGNPLPDPVHVDLRRLTKTSRLMKGFKPLASSGLIESEIGNQTALKASGQLVDTNMVIYGRGTLVSLVDTIDTVNQSITAQEQNQPNPPPAPPPPTPPPVPDKFGPPTTIGESYVIDRDTAIDTDHSITRDSITNYGKIYRNSQTDGSLSTWLFGSTSVFDNLSGFDTGTEAVSALDQMAVFKFESLQLNGNPTISTTGGISTLGLIGVNGITTGTAGGVLTFNGIDTLLLATQNGSIDLGANFSFENLDRLFVYARGAGSNLIIDSSISTGSDLHLFSEGDVDIGGALDTVNFSSFSGGDFNLTGTVHADNILVTSLGDINIGNDLTTAGSLALLSGGDINVGGMLSGLGVVAAGGNITAGTIAVPALLCPSGTLTAGAGGIHPFIGDSGADLEHVFAVGSIVSPNGIDFSGNQFGGIDGLTSGGSLTIAAQTITFDPVTGIGFCNFNGADAGGFGALNPTTAGDGGMLTVSAIGPITVNSDIEATTGKQPVSLPASGVGGTVNLTSIQDTVAVNSRIEVSSTPGPIQRKGAIVRRSASGGNINLTSGKVSGVAIDIANSAQLLSLLDSASPGPGGKITILATGASSSVNVKGRVQADRGTVDIRQTGLNGTVSLGGLETTDQLTAHADVLKVGAFGANGTLTVGQGSLSADSLLKLYAPGSNGEINFIANVTLTSGSGTILAGNTITIQPRVVVTIAGNGGPAQVYTNNPNYSGFGGRNPENGTFGGNGANDPLPLADAPPFDDVGGGSNPHSKPRAQPQPTFSRPIYSHDGYVRLGSSR